MTQKENEEKQNFRGGQGSSNYQKEDSETDHRVHSLAVNLMKTVRAGISDQTSIVESIIETIRHLMINKSKSESLKKDREVVSTKQVLLQLQTAVESLQKVSNFLQERLFDLGQQLVKGHSSAMESQRLSLVKAYQQQIQQIKTEHLLQKNKLETKVEIYQLRCSELERYLVTKTGQNPQEHPLKRKLELEKYLEAIEDLAYDLETLKNPSRASLYHTEASFQHPISNATVPFHHAQYWHQASRNSQDLQGSQKSHNQGGKSEICSVLEDYYPQKPSDMLERVNRFDRNRAEIRSAYIRVSNSKGHSPRGEQITQGLCNSPQKIMIRHEPRINPAEVRIEELSKRLSTQQYSNKITAGIARASPIKVELYREPGEKRRRDQDTYTKVQERNVRMQSVEEKLYGLKRKLERQLRSMRN